ARRERSQWRAPRRYRTSVPIAERPLVGRKLVSFAGRHDSAFWTKPHIACHSLKSVNLRTKCVRVGAGRGIPCHVVRSAREEHYIPKGRSSGLLSSVYREPSSGEEEAVELRRFFDRAIQASFHDLAFPGDPAARYLADLLTRFARTENLYPRGTTVPRLESVVDMMLEMQGAWQADSPDFRPQHEVNVRRHLGDYPFFRAGLSRGGGGPTAGPSFYPSRGKRPHRFVPEPAGPRPKAPPPPWRRLAEHFESYAGALDYARRVHFFAAP